jgi:predicted nuclease of predicted toxin-antitoxin system
MPASVANVLQTRGHECILLTDVLPPDSPDIVVAKIAELNDCILVTQDKDFKQIARRIPNGAKAGVSRLSRISLQCETPMCAARVEAAMSFIELEWEIAQASADKRMLIHIGTNSMRTSR